MQPVLLADLKMTIESESYIDAMHGILSHKGWTSCSKSMLAGMTVTAFRFSINRRLTAESSTAYNWMAENFLAPDFIGIAASQSAGYIFDATFSLYQKQAISDIKESIDRGVGVVIWKDRFVIVAGYDDKREVLYISDGSIDGYRPLYYSDFGHNSSPYWYYQYFEDRIMLDEMEIYKESLMQAIFKWETHDLMLPETEYACGRSAYDAIIYAFQSGDYDQEGAREVFRCYAAAKRDISIYTNTLAHFWPQISSAADYYTKLAQIFEQVAQITSFLEPSEKPGTRDVEALIDLFRDAKQLEENAIQCLKLLMIETMDNRFNDIALR